MSHRTDAEEYVLDAARKYANPKRIKMSRYIARVLESIETKPGCWNTLVVGVFCADDDGAERQVGKYERNYPALYATFFHFTRNGIDYALYSPDYTATRLMRLPECEDIGGEERDTFGFCPVQYYVPKIDDEDEPCFGFVAGCVWGDDSAWKIQHLDLDVMEGKIKRTARYGYVELTTGYLGDAIDIIRDEDNRIISVAVRGEWPI